MVKLFFKRLALATVLFCGMTVAMFTVAATAAAIFRAAKGIPPDVVLVGIAFDVRWWILLATALAAASAWIAEGIIKAPKPAVSDAGEPADGISR